MISETVSHYYILSKLGAGGMGEVYLAEDKRLGRQVALKFLPASYQYDPDRRARLLNEARAASLLRSPNAAAIYDIDEHEGSIFIVMEYADGELLSRKIERGALPVREAVTIAMQIADALGEAHSLGIIHCDIKSSNITVNERGLVKILDFGIAKLVSAAAESDTERTVEIGQQTALGAVLGTVSYMSPEQALGRGVDHRSDIFSLGVVIYEMLTARLPFVGSSSNEIIDNIIHQEPSAIARFNTTVPFELERIVRKCLEKDRENRYEGTREMLIDLRNFQRDNDSGFVPPDAPRRQTQVTRRPRARKTIDSLAILPLVNMSADPGMEYLSDGITESIITNLSQLPRLRVMARSTVFRYKSRYPKTAQPDPRLVASELGVDAVLTGRVLKRGDALIIKVELVDSKDGAQLWGEQYSRTLSDIFALEEDIAGEISDKLRLRLSGEQKKRLTRRQTENAEAYQAYLKGRYYWNKRTAEGLKRGAEYFEQAIDIDPNYALPYSGLADAYALLGTWDALPPKEVLPKAKAAATRALELDDSRAEAHTSLACVMMVYDWDPVAAGKQFRRAIELNPNYATAHHWYAYNLSSMGYLDQALAQISRAQDLDPLSVVVNTDMGEIAYWAGQYDLAIEQCQKTIEMDPDFAPAHYVLGFALERKSLMGQAIEEFKRARLLSGAGTWTIGILGHAYAVSGDRQQADRLLSELKERSERGHVSPYDIAVIHAGLGETDLAFEWLEKAFEARSSPMAFLKVEPYFNSLHRDPRFTDLLVRVGVGHL